MLAIQSNRIVKINQLPVNKLERILDVETLMISYPYLARNPKVLLPRSVISQTQCEVRTIANLARLAYFIRTATSHTNTLYASHIKQSTHFFEDVESFRTSKWVTNVFRAQGHYNVTT